MWHVDQEHFLTLLNPLIAPRAKLENTGELTMLLEIPLEPFKLLPPDLTRSSIIKMKP